VKRLVALVVFAVVAVVVRVDCSIAETKRSEGMVTPVKEDQAIKGQGVNAPSVKQALLNSRGFDMDWSCGDKSGRSIVFFLEDDKMIVADIQVVDIQKVDINDPRYYGLERCTTNAKLTDNGIIFNGCSFASRNIPLAYDPGNVKTPFKGSGENCSRIELSPR
jgi:hypothetical protein